MRIGIGIAQGLALGAELPMIGVSTLMTMAQGAWRKTAQPVCWQPLTREWAKFTGPEYQRDENGIWHGEETEAVLKPEIVHERMQQLSGEWVTVGTGWQARPDLGKESGLVLRDGEVLLPAAEDMLPIALSGYLPRVKRWRWNMPSRFICVTTSHGRNFRAKNESLRVCPEKKRSRIMAVQKNVIKGILAGTFALMLSGLCHCAGRH